MSMKAGSNNRGKAVKPRSSRMPILIGVVVLLILVISSSAFFLTQKHTTSTAVTTTQSSKPIILYVNQGNALVDTSNYTALLNFAKTNGFNTIFFQVYRSGSLLFTESNLTYFVDTAHIENLKIFFALYFTATNQPIPTSIYNLGEDGINLDMSTLSGVAQSNLLTTLQQNYKEGKTSVTATNFTTTLKPGLLILETYQVQNSSKDSYIHSGIIASVEPLSMSSKKVYQSQYQYDLSSSDGVMVFDYYGLLKTGY
ncbi:MAG: hypothetical protein ABSE82_05865 [Nitrososphaerales archaeon]|jgi:hypothetical protein